MEIICKDIVVIFKTNILRIVGFYVRHSAIAVSYLHIHIYKHSQSLINFFVSVICNILVPLCPTVKSQGCCLDNYSLVSQIQSFFPMCSFSSFLKKMYSIIGSNWLSKQEHIFIILKDLVIINFLLISFLYRMPKSVDNIIELQFFLDLAVLTHT